MVIFVSLVDGTGGGIDLVTLVVAGGLKGFYFIPLSESGQEEDRQRTQEAGFNEHLVKPVDLAALLNLLNREKKH